MTDSLQTICNKTKTTFLTYSVRVYIQNIQHMETFHSPCSLSIWNYLLEVLHSCHLLSSFHHALEKLF